MQNLFSAALTSKTKLNVIELNIILLSDRCMHDAGRIIKSHLNNWIRITGSGSRGGGVVGKQGVVCRQQGGEQQLKRLCKQTNLRDCCHLVPSTSFGVRIHALGGGNSAT